jgi:hypothetical protein
LFTSLFSVLFLRQILCLFAKVATATDEPSDHLILEPNDRNVYYVRNPNSLPEFFVNSTRALGRGSRR